MNRVIVIMVLVVLCMPLIGAHPNHDHSAVGEPNHPEYDLTRMSILSGALLILIGVWALTTYQRKDRESTRDTTDQEPGWLNWYDRNFESFILFLLVGAVGGAVIDAYEHAHGVIETIFAPGHVIAASAAGGAFIAFGILIAIRYSEAGSIRETIPDGYLQSAVALPLFFLGFLMDMGWHRLFGFEDSGIEVMSPTHLWVLTMGLLLVSGPLRRAWYTENGDTWRDQFSMLTSTALLLWVLSFLMRLVYPYLTVFPAEWFHKSLLTLGPTLGVAGMLVFSILVMVVVLHIVDRFDVVPGGLTYIYALAAIGMVAVEQRWYFVPAILATGFAMDLLYHWLQPSRDRLFRYRIFALSIPMIFALTYHATIWWLGGIIWVTHVWAGSIAFAGIGGLLASHAVQPVPMERLDGPQDEEAG